MIQFSEQQIKELSETGTLEQWVDFKNIFYHPLRRLVEKLENERILRVQAEKKEEHKRELKKLTAYSQVWYMRNSVGDGLQYGQQLTKIKDGIDYMTCQATKGKWKIPYSELSATEPTRSQVETNRGLVKLLTNA